MYRLAGAALRLAIGVGPDPLRVLDDVRRRDLRARDRSQRHVHVERARAHHDVALGRRRLLAGRKKEIPAAAARILSGDADVGQRHHPGVDGAAGEADTGRGRRNLEDHGPFPEIQHHDDEGSFVVGRGARDEAAAASPCRRRRCTWRPGRGTSPRAGSPGSPRAFPRSRPERRAGERVDIRDPGSSRHVLDDLPAALALARLGATSAPVRSMQAAVKACKSVSPSSGLRRQAEAPAASARSVTPGR